MVNICNNIAKINHICLILVMESGSLKFLKGKSEIFNNYSNWVTLFFRE
jgi:hypothetical protein